MARKIILALFIFLNFAIFSSAAQGADEILYEVITQSEAQDLMINIPTDATAGYKDFEVNVSGEEQVPVIKHILFCKDLDGAINWDNKCPQFDALALQSKLESAELRSELPIYDPKDNPKNTTNTAIVAFAVLSAVAGTGVLAKYSLEAPKESAEHKQGYLAGLSRGSALIATTQLGRGDSAKLWKSPINLKIDKLVSKSGSKISGFSPLGTRILSDGNYQRSLLGPLSLIIYPAAIAIGILASSSLHQEALPPSLFFILLMMTVGVLDAFAGLLLSLAFALSVAIGGHLNSWDSALTVAGVSLLAFSPALVAGAFRPFRRAVWDFTSLWERGTDYLLGSILTGWVVQQIVLGLPGLSGLQLPITTHARSIALWAAGLVAIRFFLEDLSLHLFPKRLNDLEPEYRERTIFQQVLALLIKVSVFGVIAGRFIGISVQLFIGVALFTLPLIMGIFEDKFPKSEKLQKWMPTGIIEMLVMTVGGYFLAISVSNKYPDAQNYVLASFVILSLPGFVLKILGLFGKDGAEDWRVTRFGKATYRILGVVALGILIYIILSGLLISNKV